MSKLSDFISTGGGQSSSIDLVGTGKQSPAFTLSSGVAIDLGPSPNKNPATGEVDGRWVVLGTSTLSYVNSAGTPDWTKTATTAVLTAGAQPISGVHFNADGSEFFVCYMHPTTAGATFDIITYTTATGAVVKKQITTGAFTYGGAEGHEGSMLVDYNEGTGEVFLVTLTGGTPSQLILWRINVSTGAAFKEPAILGETPYLVNFAIASYAAKDKTFFALVLHQASSSYLGPYIYVYCADGRYLFDLNWPFLGRLSSWFLDADGKTVGADHFELRADASTAGLFSTVCVDRTLFDAEIKAKLLSVYGVTI